MKRVFLSALVAAVVGVAVSWPSVVAVEAAPPATPTFNRDVLPVMQRQCQECHRPNSIAPMSFMTYKDTRPYARAIEKAVVGRTMPPWFADPFGGALQEHQIADRCRDRNDQHVGQKWSCRRPESLTSRTSSSARTLRRTCG
jgi:hypothetical protein